MKHFLREMQSTRTRQEETAVPSSRSRDRLTDPRFIWTRLRHGECGNRSLSSTIGG